MISADKARRIKAVILDIDGVLTDGRVGYGGNELIKFFHYRDGHWLKLALRAGLIVGLLSGRESRANRERATELGLTFVRENIHDKLVEFEKLLTEYDLTPEECLYIGDTGTDMKTGKNAGLYTVGVLWGFRGTAELLESGADMIIEKPQQLLDCVTK